MERIREEGMAGMMRFKRVVCRLVAISLFWVGLGGTAWAQVAGEISTTRDEHGVWFIEGADDTSLYDLFEAMGHAVATDRLWQAELYRRQARGNLAELFGPGYVQTDVFMRTIAYTEAELQDGYDILNQDTRDLIAGYVSGFNRRIDEVNADASLMPFEFAALSRKLGVPVVPRPWSETDVLAWLALVQRNFDPAARDTGPGGHLGLLQHLQSVAPDQAWAMFEDLRWTNDADADTYLERHCASVRRHHGSATGAMDSEFFIHTAARLSAERKEIFAGLEKINARVRMGSYAWVVSGAHTQSGHPILYSGPQMGFSVPAIIAEGSLKGAGLEISGMTIPGIPFLNVGRTPHHAWSSQVGHAHTTDYYFHTKPGELDLAVRIETISVAGAPDVALPVYRSQYGPVIAPASLDPSTYTFDGTNPIVSWRYAHWGHEFKTMEGFLEMIRAESMDEFGAGVEKIAVSQHFCYADRDGNIAYWMSGRNPERYAGEWRLPQGSLPEIPAGEWVDNERIPTSTDRNTAKGYYAGWNNKTHPDYDNGYNSINDIYGPFHRSHAIYDYLDRRLRKRHGHKFSFEELRDLALNIASTDSVGIGGNPWPDLSPYFKRAVWQQWWRRGDWQRKIKRWRALRLLRHWDGHFPAGSPETWSDDPDRADAWMLMDAWVHEALRLTFGDELGVYLHEADDGVMAAKQWPQSEKRVLINVLLHALDRRGDIANEYNWFENIREGESGRNKIIISALDNALDHLGSRPWGEGQRGWITYTHPLLGEIGRTPFASRSTYAQIVEMGPEGPVRIESMFPLGQSGHIGLSATGEPAFDPNFFSMKAVFDSFAPRDFPLFE